jgi:hypothetical protein
MGGLFRLASVRMRPAQQADSSERILAQLSALFPIPVAVLSKASACDRLVAVIADPAKGMDVCLLCLYVELYCVGRGLCDGLITRLEESYSVSNCACD